MSLADALATLMAARGMKPADVANAMIGAHNRATIYRVLSGDTTDPRVSTLVAACKALNVAPVDLLQLAGLLEAPPGHSLLDVSLRQTFSELRDLNDDDRRLLLGVIRGIVDLRARERRTRHPERTGA